MWHHLCSIILDKTIRFEDIGSNIFLNNDNANVSNFVHGVITGHASLLFHFTYSAQPSDG